MTRFRTPLFLTAVLLILTATTILILIARGYKLDLATKALKPTGLLLATSIPNGASVFVNGKLETATDSPVSLSPGTYEVGIKKEGFSPWKKTLQIEKEVVTKTDAYLFPSVPSLSPLTYTGAQNPLFSPDGTKIIYTIPLAEKIGLPAEALRVGGAKAGLWLADLVEGPFGLFAKEPRRLLKNTSVQNFSQSDYEWSPDSRQVLLTFSLSKDKKENFLLDVSQSPANLINVSWTISILRKQWQKDNNDKQKIQMEKLPKGLAEILSSKATDLAFSADQTKILYTATASATLPENLIPPLLGSSTQKQERTLKAGRIYVYDLKEDRNFFIGEAKFQTRNSQPATEKQQKPNAFISWFPTSRHLLLVEKEKISLLDYDGANQQEVYSGFFEYPYVFAAPSANKLILLTRLGSTSPLNLYSLSLR
jgi:hypothetical protein